MTLSLLAACGQDAPRTSPATAPTPTPPAVTATADAGSAAPAPDPTLQRLVDETIDYTYKMVPLVASWDGSCSVQIQRMKQIEPLVQRIRDDTAALGPDANTQLKAALAPHKDEVTAKIEHDLADLHVTRAEVEAKDDAVKAACGNDPEYKAEMDRIGVFKKNKP